MNSMIDLLSKVYPGYWKPIEKYSSELFAWLIVSKAQSAVQTDALIGPGAST